MRFDDAPFGSEPLHFVHKRIIGGAIGLLTGGPTAAVTGFIRQTAQTPAPIQMLPDPLAAPTPGTDLFPDRHRRTLTHRALHMVTGTPLGNGGGCPQGTLPDVDGSCVAPGSPGDLARGGTMGGVAVMGRHGAALVPTTETRVQRECLPGMVLGNDDLCYNRRDIRNSDRKYPKGRAPLLTGGERNAISKAARAAKKIARTTKQLQKLGMLPKPKSAPKKQKQQQLIGPGITVIDTE